MWKYSNYEQPELYLNNVDQFDSVVNKCMHFVKMEYVEGLLFTDC